MTGQSSPITPLYLKLGACATLNSILIKKKKMFFFFRRWRSYPTFLRCRFFQNFSTFQIWRVAKTWPGLCVCSKTFSDRNEIVTSSSKSNQAQSWLIKDRYDLKLYHMVSLTWAVAWKGTQNPSKGQASDRQLLWMPMQIPLFFCFHAMLYVNFLLPFQNECQLWQSNLWEC